MSKLNSIFNSIPVKVPSRSGFDLSHEHLFTGTTGTLIPVSVIECLPGDKISIGSSFKVTFPPFAAPFMGRIDFCLEAFFVPNRMVWSGWESFITKNNGISPSAPGAEGFPLSVPTLQTTQPNNLLGPGTLCDYLGFKMPFSPGSGNNISFPSSISALPFLRYQKICDDWYRDDATTLPFFPKLPLSISSLNGESAPRMLPFYQSDISAPLSSLGAPSSNNGAVPGTDITVGLGSLRQRCWAKDYFTTATYEPQAGQPATVVFDTSGNTGQFSISTLRAANGLQKWLERNNIAGTDYGDQIMAHFGVRPPSAIMNRAILLGALREPVYVGSVENNSGVTNSSNDTQNPFASAVGGNSGTGGSAGKGRLVNSFDVKEHGAIYVIASIVPHAYYSSGLERYLKYTTTDSFAWPELAFIGDQPIYNYELDGSVQNETVFGYQQRYADWKHKKDIVSGLLNDFVSNGGTQLKAFALQRNISGDSELGKEFAEIPLNYLDQVQNASFQITGFSYMADVYIDCSALRPLPEYSLPSL